MEGQEIMRRTIAIGKGSAYDPWPDMGDELNDYEYFEQFDKQKLVKLCVSHMRRTRLEIVIRKNCEGEMEAARRLAEEYRDRCKDPFMPGLRHREWLPWEVGK